MNPLTALPPQVRAAFYWLYAVVGVVLGGFQVAQQGEVFGLDLTKTMAVFAYVGTALAITAGSNLPSAEDVLDGDAPMPRDQRGVTDTFVAIMVTVAVVLLILIAFGWRR